MTNKKVGLIEQLRKEIQEESNRIGNQKYLDLALEYLDVMEKSDVPFCEGRYDIMREVVVRNKTASNFVVQGLDRHIRHMESVFGCPKKKSDFSAMMDMLDKEAILRKLMPISEFHKLLTALFGPGGTGNARDGCILAMAWLGMRSREAKSLLDEDVKIGKKKVTIYVKEKEIRLEVAEPMYIDLFQRYKDAKRHRVTLRGGGTEEHFYLSSPYFLKKAGVHAGVEDGTLSNLGEIAERVVQIHGVDQNIPIARKWQHFTYTDYYNSGITWAVSQEDRNRLHQDVIARFNSRKLQYEKTVGKWMREEM